MTSDLMESPSFAHAWQEWCDYRRETRKPLTSRAVKMQMRRLQSWGADRAIAAIEYSIGQGYQGLFEERNNASSSGPARRQAAPGKYDKVTIHRANDN